MDKIQAQFTAWVNDVVKKTDEFILGTMERYLTEKGYADIFEINGANLIAAIEKQIPKKPNITLRGTTGWNTEAYCPVCKTMVHSNYCSGCGQAIKWGE